MNSPYFTTMTTIERHDTVARAQRQLYDAARNFDRVNDKVGSEMHLTAQVTLTLAMWSESGDVFAAMLEAQLLQLAKYLNAKQRQ